MSEGIIDPQAVIDQKDAKQTKAEKKFQKQVDKVSDRIATRALRKIKKGETEFPVKGTLIGRFQTAHTEPVHDAVLKKLAESENKIEAEVQTDQIYSPWSALSFSTGMTPKDRIKVNKVNGREV